MTAPTAARGRLESYSTQITDRAFVGAPTAAVMIDGLKLVYFPVIDQPDIQLFREVRL